MYVPCTVHGGEGTGVVSVIQVDVRDGVVVVVVTTYIKKHSNAIFAAC